MIFLKTYWHLFNEKWCQEKIDKILEQRDRENQVGVDILDATQAVAEKFQAEVHKLRKQNKQLKQDKGRDISYHLLNNEELK